MVLRAEAPVIEDHLSCFVGPCTPAYQAMPEKHYRLLEARLNRIAEFVGAVIVPFVMDDFKQFFVSVTACPTYAATGNDWGWFA